MRIWDGKTVHFSDRGLTGIFDHRDFEMGMTERTARELALTLAKCKQTYFTIPSSIQEILDALNYVLVGDPASVQAHSRMEAGKGMTPDGGHKAPDPVNRTLFADSKPPHEDGSFDKHIY